MSVVGGAVLARYMLPVVPLVILAWIATLWRRLRYWKLIVTAVAIAFAAGLFSNPPYGFSLEDNLAYRDYILLHAEASRFLATQYPGKRILTAWPASDELSRPWLGYIDANANANSPFRVLRIEDFSNSQVDAAARLRDQFDVALVFSTKYQPPHPLLGNWETWQRLKEQFFGYHRDSVARRYCPAPRRNDCLSQRTERAVGRGNCSDALSLRRECNRGDFTYQQRQATFRGGLV